MSAHEWLAVHHGDLPFVVSFPHTGTEIPPDIEERLVSPWLARKDADFWVDVLYDFAHEMGATTLRTSLSRTVVDVNRDPSGASLYPGMNTTGLCPTGTFDGEPLYQAGREPNAEEIARRRAAWFDPYHAALREQLDRLRTRHDRVVLWDAHSIRSRVPRLFEGELPQFNIGTNNGASCAPELTRAIEKCCDTTRLPRVTDGRFRGGWITRHYGVPRHGFHAVQMELAMRGYLHEPPRLDEQTWPAPLDDAHAARLRVALRDAFTECISFAMNVPLK
ncbi:MAG TPA: N-formylglutamate deformylase [Steroidobacteraceae bacterium]